MAGILSLFGHGYEPMSRIWHASWQTGNKTLLYSGVTKDYSNKTKKRLASVVEVFDSYTESWQQKVVTGETPAPGLCSAATALIDNDLFTFGGWDGSRWYNSLHRLSHSSKWFAICPQENRAESPMAKQGSGMVAFGDNLALFGGYGIPHGPAQPGSSFQCTGLTDSAGWTNEFHMFNLTDGM